MKKKALLTVAAIILTLSSHSQETPEKFSAGGYASWLHNAMFENPSDIWINSSMLHNRLNFKAYPGSRTTITLEVRNRLITGDLLLADPSYASSIGYDQGWIDMSWNIIDEQSVILNTFIDRASVDFTAGTVQVRAGRQRINWSQALVWNPNDIFNTYSYFDFDYIERPGSDAVRVIWSPGASSSAEIAVKADNTGAVTAAALWRFSIPGADLQFLAGESEGDMITLGTGWSANAGSSKGVAGNGVITNGPVWFRGLIVNRSSRITPSTRIGRPLRTAKADSASIPARNNVAVVKPHRGSRPD